MTTLISGVSGQYGTSLSFVNRACGPGYSCTCDAGGYCDMRCSGY